MNRNDEFPTGGTLLFKKYIVLFSSPNVNIFVGIQKFAVFITGDCNLFQAILTDLEGAEQVRFGRHENIAKCMTLQSVLVNSYYVVVVVLGVIS